MSPTAVRAAIAHLLGLALLAWATLAQATPQVASVESPGKILKVSLVLDGGTARYRVERFDEPVVEDSKLGLPCATVAWTAIRPAWPAAAQRR